MIPALRDATSADRRLDAARRILAAAAAARVDLDRLALLAAAALDAPVALVTVLSEVRDVVGSHGLDARTETLLPDLVRGPCALVVERGAVVAVDDVADLAPDDERRRTLTSGHRSYLGVPLADPDGALVGAVAVLDVVARTWTAAQQRILEALAESVLAEITLHHESERHGRLLSAFESAPVAVAVVRGGDRAVAYANPAFTGLFPGAAPPGDGGLPHVDTLGTGEIGTRVDEVLATGEAVRVESQRTPRDEEQVATLSFSPITAALGAPPDVLVVGVDVTAQVQDRRSILRRADEQQLLASAAAALQEAVEPVAELRALTRSLVPAFADACSAILLDTPVAPGAHDGGPLAGARVAFVAADDGVAAPPERAGLEWGTGAQPLHDAIRTGRPASSEVGAGGWEDTGGSRDWVRAVGVGSVAAAPIRSGGLVLGLLTFATGPDRPVFTRADLGVMERIAARAGAAVGQGLTYQRQRDASLALQRSMLTDAPIVPGLEVVTRYRPTAVDAEVGGDWYDAFALPGGDLAVAIGDVAGHDLGAAATMGQLRSMLRALAYDRDAVPGEILARLDAVASGLEVTDFTSVALGRLRVAPGGGDGAERGSPTLHWSNAGHPPPVLVDPDGRAVLLEDGAGMVLGVRPGRPRRTASVPVPRGGTLLLYTDGLVERRGRFPDASAVTLVEQAAAASDGTLDGLCDALLSPAPVDDDVALLAVRLDR